MFLGHQPVVDAAVEAGFAGEVDVAARGFDDESGPKRHAPVARPARRPVMRGLDMNRRAIAGIEPFAPVVRGDAHAGHGRADDGIVADRRHDQRVMALLQPLQRREVEVVVVIVADQHHVDRRQVGEGDARLVDPLRPGEGEWRGAVRPHRIGQDVQPGRLDQQRGVADHGEPQRIAPHPPDGPGAGMGTGPCRRPFRATAAELPLEEIGEPAGRLAVGIEKQRAVEMIAGRAAVVAVGGFLSDDQDFAPDKTIPRT